MLEKFRRWIAFNPPSALSWDDWEKFDTEFKEKAPIRYFLVKVIGSGARRYAYRLSEIPRWVQYRTTRRFHMIDTKLEPGYYDKDTLILHGMFSILVDYVEGELAWMEIAFSTEEMKKELGWRYHLPRMLRPKYRNREAGLKHLDWEATLDSEALHPNERSPDQARRAKEIKALYLWWTEERPKRKELEHPLDETVGLNSLSQKWKQANPKKDAALTKWARDSHTLEEAWAHEDTVMLLKLVKIRRGLWT